MEQQRQDSAILAALESISSSQARLEEALATIESRVSLAYDKIARIAETTTRIKLLADNAKQISLAHAEALKSIESRLKL